MREVKQRRTSGLSRRRQYETSKSDRDTRLNRGQHEGDFSKKQGYAVIIVVLLIAGTFFGLWLSGNNNPIFHSKITLPNPDCTASQRIIGQCDPPSTTVLWRATSPNNNLGEFNTLLSMFTSINPLSLPAISLQPNSTNPAIAITKQPIDISSVNSKQLWIGMSWDAKLFGSCCGASPEFGWYLTINGTVPLTHNYNPYVDPSVGFLFRITPVSSTSTSNFVYIQRKQSETLISEDNGCGGTGSVYICQGTTGLTPVTNEIPAYLGNLNFTGASATSVDCTSSAYTGSGCSNITVGGNTAHGSSGIFPPLSTTPLYYIGFYALANSGFAPTFVFSTGHLSSEVSMFAYQTVATPNPIPASSTTDTGGFFGAVGRFLSPLANVIGGVGSTIWGAISNPLQGIAGAFNNAINTFIADMALVVRIVLNSIGNFFGLGNVGDDVINFFNGIANWLVNVFGGIISQIGNIANGFSSGVTGLQNLFVGWGAFLVSSLGVLGNLPTILLTIWNDVLPAAYAISFIVILWWVFGTYQAWRDFESGDFIAVLPVIGMTFTLLLWLGSSVAFNPISANTTVTNAYNTAFNQVSWFLTILIPIFLVVMFGEMGSNTERRGHKSLEHFNVWLSITNIVFLKIYNISFLIAKESWGMILTIKQLVSGWL